MSARRTFGIRREDKHEWERRVPLTPDAVSHLTKDEGLRVLVQSSPIRVFKDEAYERAGAEISEDLSSADVVFAVKEIPEELFRQGGAYVFFSHTIKGQPHSMPMLRRMMELGCTLIDYERIADDQGRRLVFFGQNAGRAGMIDTLWLAGRRFEAQGLDTPFRRMRLAHEYAGLDEVRRAVAEVGEAIRSKGLPKELAPFVCGFTGYGNVSLGAQEMYDLLQCETVAPDALGSIEARSDRVYKVEFREEHLVEPVRDGALFQLQEYYDHPERYRSKFERYLPHLNVLINAVYWAPQYPRLLTLNYLKALYARERKPRLRVVGDISCDIDGSVESTIKATTPGEPSYIFRPDSGEHEDGFSGPGLAMMTTDCLPCELPGDSSETFTKALLPFVAEIARARFDGAFEDAGLSSAIARATVLWRGEFTPDFAYLADAVR
jgi:alanine dehydrogenase